MGQHPIREGVGWFVDEVTVSANRATSQRRFIGGENDARLSANTLMNQTGLIREEMRLCLYIDV